MKQLINQISTAIPNFADSINILTTNWQNFVPTNPKLLEATQIVNYILVATVITGLFVYHYIKEKEYGNNSN